MSARSAVGRIAEMDREELRFRVTCEARKVAGRVRYAIHPPRWNRGALAGILNPGAGPLVRRAAEAIRRHDHQAAHRALAGHFAARPSAWPLKASHRARLSEKIRRQFPEAAAAARQRADAIVDGRHDLLGYRNVALGHPPDWHADRIHARRAPLVHWASVPYLDPASGDHKIIWETNRHQYFLILGTAYWLTGDPRYRKTFIAHLQDWLRANPPLRGINWSSMLELAFRTLSWTWAVEFFAAGAEHDETPWLVDLLVSLDRQLTHVSHNLSSYFSPNTHLSGEALALYAVSTAFPELRRSAGRAAAGREILLREAHNQVRPDGGHAELSAHYHRYSTDFYLLALMLARAAGDPSAPAFEQTARKQAHYLRTLADDGGRLPLLGDDDGGQLFRFGPVAPADASDTLGAAATVLRDDALAVGRPSAETSWILGQVPGPRPGPQAHWPSRVLSDSGYLVSRSEGDSQLIFDAGPHGFLNGGHAHADALAVVLTVNGDPVLVDPGTATYTMDAGARDRFRSSRMHNTLILDGRDHATAEGPFHWRSRADARFLVARTGSDMDFAVGTHDAYGPGRHMRAVLALHGLGWLIVDRLDGDRPSDAEIFWHLHPAWQASIQGRRADLIHSSGRQLAIVTTAPALDVVPGTELGAYAPEYGRVERAPTLVSRVAVNGPVVIGTFIPAGVATSPAPSLIERREASNGPAGWRTATFMISGGREDVEVRLAFPATGEAQPRQDWPQPCITQLDEARNN